MVGKKKGERPKLIGIENQSSHRGRRACPRVTQPQNDCRPFASDLQHGATLHLLPLQTCTQRGGAEPPALLLHLPGVCGRQVDQEPHDVSPDEAGGADGRGARGWPHD